MKLTKMKFAGLTAFSFGAVALTATAVAQRGPGGEGDRQMRGERMVERFDANGDGDISKEEIETVRAQEFAAADTNGDGALTLEEVQAHQEAKRAERRAQRQQAMFDRLDTDGNGVLTEDEFGPREMERFDRIDSNDDGVISEAEREAAAENRRGRRGQRRR